MTLLRNKCFGLHSEPHSLKRTSQMQTASTAAPTSYIDLDIAKACHHALCSTILYTATIQSLYSHYTATIQPEEVMSETWGLYVGAPAERSGESDKWEYTPNVLYNGVPGSTRRSTPNVLYNGSRMVRW